MKTRLVYILNVLSDIHNGKICPFNRHTKNNFTARQYFISDKF